MKTILFLMSSLLVCSSYAQTIEDYGFQAEVTFLSGRKELSDESRYALSNQIAEQVRYYRDAITQRNQSAVGFEIRVKEVIIKSRTDAKGSEETNMVISQARALSVQNDVQVLFTKEGIPYDANVFSAVGLGESEADENKCTYNEKVCRYDVKPMRDHLINRPDKEVHIAIQVLEYLNDLIIPSAHAYDRGTLMEELFGNDDDEVYYEDEQEYIPPRNVGNGDDVWMDPNQTVDIFGNPQQEVRQCNVVRYNEDCLNGQRVTTIEVILEYVEKHQPEPLPAVVALPEVAPVAPVQPKPATQEQVVQPPVNQLPPLQPTAPLQPATPANTQPATPAATTPATPAPTGPAKLKVYGQPVN